MQWNYFGDRFARLDL